MGIWFDLKYQKILKESYWCKDSYSPHYLVSVTVHPVPLAKCESLYSTSPEERLHFLASLVASIAQLLSSSKWHTSRSAVC